MYATYVYIYLVFKQTLSLLFHLSNTSFKSRLPWAYGYFDWLNLAQTINTQDIHYYLCSLSSVHFYLVERRTKQETDAVLTFTSVLDFNDLYGKSIFVKSGMSGKEGDPI